MKLAPIVSRLRADLTPPFFENVSFENDERAQFSSNVRVLVAERSVPMVRKNGGV
jgi:hypothetical protein